VGFCRVLEIVRYFTGVTKLCSPTHVPCQKAFFCYCAFVVHILCLAQDIWVLKQFAY